MVDAFSTPSNRIKTLILLAVSGLAAVVSAIIGIEDNPPGALFAFLAAVALILAFTHHWQTARRYLFILLAAIIGFAALILLSMVADSIEQNPASPAALRALIVSPAFNALNLMIGMICPAAFLVGAAGALTTFIRSRRPAR